MDNFAWLFGERVKQIRRSRRMTQDEFGVLLGVSRQTINAYENDRQIPPVEMMKKMSNLLAVSPIWILTGIGDMEVSDISYLSPETITYNYAVADQNLTPEQQTLVNFIIENPDKARKLIQVLIGGELSVTKGIKLPGKGSTR